METVIKKVKKVFRLWVYYTFVILFFTNCVTEKQRLKICSNCPSKSIDTVIVNKEVVIHDTIINASVSPVIQYIKLECDSNYKVKDFSQTKYNNGVKNIVTAIGGVLISECNTDSLKKVIHELREKESILNKSKEVKEKVTNVLTSFQKFCIRFFWVACIVAFIYVVFRFIKIYLKTV